MLFIIVVLQLTFCFIVYNVIDIIIWNCSIQIVNKNFSLSVKNGGEAAVLCENYIIIVKNNNSVSFPDTLRARMIRIPITWFPQWKLTSYLRA